MKFDTHMPSLEEVRARSMPPPGHEHDFVACVGDFLYWKPRAEVDGTEGLTFFDGDYRDVLEADDPKVVAALARVAA